MEASYFIDYYEILEISPNANSGTIDAFFAILLSAIIPIIRTPVIVATSKLSWRLTIRSKIQ